jgi:uncharacterized hydantoinase/oxoprolinase family protein
MRKHKVEDIEKLAEEAKQKRLAHCSEKINELLAENKCQFTLYAQLGELVIPLDQIIKLQVILNVTSK